MAETSDSAATGAGQKLYLEVFLNLPLQSSFFYSVQMPHIPANAPENTLSEPTHTLDTSAGKLDVVQKGTRAQVMFGKRKMTAFIVNVMHTLPDNLGFPAEKIKNIERVIDTQPLFSDEHIHLALWMEQYYLCSRGEALSAMLPSGRRESRVPSFSLEADATEFIKHTLSQEQTDAVNGILSTQGYRMHYLYGSTGSGKTEVFLRTAEAKLAEGKGVIYLVPEIGLTSQVVQAVTERFGKTAAVLHSALTGSQKLEQWRRIARGDARVVIGARSAVFAPVPDLGLVIIDEEHDGSYKSGNSPRYSARQIAIKRCTDAQIPLIMGSATPSVEAWYMMQEGIISEHVLTRRLSGGTMPNIELVDLGNPASGSQTGGCISSQLAQEIDDTLKQGKQTILFLNRRGFTRFFRCKSCGFELTCKNCSVALTYHKKEKMLRCHYCGWSIKPPTMCPECGSLDTEYASFGTEYIEEEIKAKFPQARIVRADSDSLNGKEDIQEKFTLFKEGKADILLGTQMVAKGLNFPGVRLVGVVSADTGLHLPDFRANERTFSLIVQVAGRAGRFFPDGKVVVQTYNPQRNAVALACSNNIEQFYRQELEQRKQLHFPPFSRLIRLVFRSANEKHAEQAAHEAADYMENLPFKNDIRILGPAECPIEKIAANYRYHILLRAKNLGPIRQAAASFLKNCKAPLGTYIEVDVDPISLL